MNELSRVAISSPPGKRMSVDRHTGDCAHFRAGALRDHGEVAILRPRVVPDTPTVTPFATRPVSGKNDTLREHLLDAADGLSCSLFVFYEAESYVAVAVVAEAYSGGDGYFGFCQQQLAELQRAKGR